jgi:hypothetical protein
MRKELKSKNLKFKKESEYGRIIFLILTFYF